MKTNILTSALAFGLCLLAFAGYGQVTYETNDPLANPIPLGYVGWNDNTNEDLDFRQNNTRRLRMSGVDWLGYWGRNAMTTFGRSANSGSGWPT